jgi:hypothetical protein
MPKHNLFASVVHQRTEYEHEHSAFACRSSSR